MEDKESTEDKPEEAKNTQPKEVENVPVSNEAANDNEKNEELAKKEEALEKYKAELEEKLARREAELAEKEADLERKKSAMVTNVQQEEQDIKKVNLLSEINRNIIFGQKHSYL